MAFVIWQILKYFLNNTDEAFRSVIFITHNQCMPIHINSYSKITLYNNVSKCMLFVLYNIPCIYFVMHLKFSISSKELTYCQEKKQMPVMFLGKSHSSKAIVFFQYTP